MTAMEGQGSVGRCLCLRYREELLTSTVPMSRQAYSCVPPGGQGFRIGRVKVPRQLAAGQWRCSVSSVRSFAQALRSGMLSLCSESALTAVLLNA
jgi:hypothetical protein